MSIDSATGNRVVQINPRYYRPAEVDSLIGNADKARRELGWSAKTSVEDLCGMMVAADLERNRNGYSV